MSFSLFRLLCLFVPTCLWIASVGIYCALFSSAPCQFLQVKFFASLPFLKPSVIIVCYMNKSSQKSRCYGLGFESMWMDFLLSSFEYYRILCYDAFLERVDLKFQI